MIRYHREAAVRMAKDVVAPGCTAYAKTSRPQRARHPLAERMAAVSNGSFDGFHLTVTGRDFLAILRKDGPISHNSVPGHGKGLLPRFPLRYTARKRRHRYKVAILIGRFQVDYPGLRLRR